MPPKNKVILKSYFENGDLPNEDEFGHLIDTIQPLLFSGQDVSITNNGDGTATISFNGTPTIKNVASSMFLNGTHSGVSVAYDEVNEVINLTVTPVSSTPVYTGGSPTNVTVGALQAGSPIAGLPLSDIIAKMVVTFINSTVSMSAFPIQEKGTSYIPTISGTITPNSGSILARRIKRGITLINEPIGNTVSFADVAQTVNQTYSIEADYTNSTGGTSTATASQGLSFYSPSYYGVGAAGLTEANIKASLAKQIWVAANRTDLSFSPTLQRYYFVEPAAYGTRGRIIDQNGFNVTDSFTRTQVTFTLADGVSTELMNIYMSNADTTQTNFKLSFYFS